ncbi:MAG: thioredoxin [Caldicoprobacterales bacterium]|jgi:thioredoxin 1|nr:thioredoxin [Clostridiales bacterium]
MASDKVVVLDSNNFEHEVLKSDLPVLVDFWAAWCGPCKMIAPIIDQLAEEYDGKAKIAKVNVDDNRDLAVQFKVMSIPTLILFKDGEIVDQIMGARPKAELEKFIQKAL